MIGNDIIDLVQAKKESNWQRPGYLNKLFWPEEQQIIHQSSNQHNMVWSLWSMKEAVYKAEFRRTMIFEYAPLKVKCLSFNEAHQFLHAEFEYNSIKYFTFTRVFSNFLHTIACRWKEDFLSLKLIEVEDYPEEYVTYLIMKKFISKNQFIIKEDNGLPNLVDLNKNSSSPLSISHHGKYLGIIISPFYKI